MSQNLKVLYGKPIADSILETIKEAVKTMYYQPRLAVIAVGDDKASRQYLEMKRKRAATIGIDVQVHPFPVDTTESIIINCISSLDDVDGILIQVPLPQHLDLDVIIRAIPMNLNIDSFHTPDQGAMLSNVNIFEPVFPAAMIRLVECSGIDLSTATALVIGNSEGFKNVMISSLLRKNIQSSFLFVKDLFHEGSLERVRQADIIISAIGTAGRLNGSFFRSGAVVIDGGIDIVNGKAMGDVDYASCEALNLTITPVPGGVGPVTIAILLQNVLIATQLRMN